MSNYDRIELFYYLKNTPLRQCFASGDPPKVEGDIREAIYSLIFVIFQIGDPRSMVTSLSDS